MTHYNNFFPEFQMNLTEDDVRCSAVINTLAKENHVMGKFTLGWYQFNIYWYDKEDTKLSVVLTTLMNVNWSTGRQTNKQNYSD